MTLPPLLNRRPGGVKRKKGGPPGGGRNRAGRSNGAGVGGLTPIARVRRDGDRRRMPVGRGGAGKGSTGGQPLSRAWRSIFLMMRRRPGTVTKAIFVKVPGLQRV